MTVAHSEYVAIECRCQHETDVPQARTSSIGESLEANTGLKTEDGSSEGA